MERDLKLDELRQIIQSTGLTVNDYALQVLGCHPSRLYELGLGGGGATPVSVRPAATTDPILP